jgi:uncharacterized membrane protein YfcA
VALAAVLVPLGAWLALTRPTRPGTEPRAARTVPLPVLILLAAAGGCVGGIYGIGGGSILAPILIGPVAPDWPTGIALGIGGLVGAYTGRRAGRAGPVPVRRSCPGGTEPAR